MIVKENLTIKDQPFIRQYSDQNFYIEREGVKYAEAIDPAEFKREYIETKIPIEDDMLADVVEAES